MNLIDTLVNTRLKIERGQSWFNFLKTPAILAASLRILGLEITYTIVLSIILIWIFYIVGIIDRRYGIWLRENEIRTRDYNPYFKELENKVNK